MTSTLERCQKLWKQTSQSRPKFPSFASNRPAFTQVKELFARSSVSCLTGDELQGVTAEQGDPCWQVTQQLHLLIEKVRFPHRSATKRSAFSLGETASDAVSELGPPVDSINDWLSGPELCGLHWIRSSPTHWSLELTHPHTHTLQPTDDTAALFNFYNDKQECGPARNTTRSICSLEMFLSRLSDWLQN